MPQNVVAATPQNEASCKYGPKNVEPCSIERELGANTVDRVFKVRTKPIHAYVARILSAIIFGGLYGHVSWGHLGAIVATFGAILSRLGTIVGGHLWAILGHLGAILGLFWGHLGAILRHLGAISSNTN